MKTAAFDVILEQPLVISRSAATAGSHQSLDYLPGSVFLGLAAARLYAELNSDSAWTLFHSGAVRFGDALPLHGGETARPTPLALHAAKGSVSEKDGRYRAEALFDPAIAPAAPDVQPVQLREGYLTATGLKVRPRMVHTLKTAIDRKTGFAAEGQLFGYEALAEGQRFRFSLSADAAVADALWQRLVAALAGDAKLGRSRTAQFGQVLIRPADSGTLPPPTADGNRLCLWLQSDLALSRGGQPVLQPDPDLLGLPEGTIWLAGKSHLRSRRYSLFNAFRRSHDPERQVISRGSVLRFELPRPLDEGEMARLTCGVGLYTESGLGQVWINPPMLREGKPAFDAAASAAHAADLPAPARPNTPLIRALVRRAGTAAAGTTGEALARELFSELCAIIGQARRFAGLKPGQPLAQAPGRSQWGRLKQLANDHRDDAKGLWRQLAESEDRVFRARADAPWGLRYGPGNREVLFQWLIDRLRPHSAEHGFPLLVGQLAAFGLQTAWQDCCDGRTNPIKEDLQ